MRKIVHESPAHLKKLIRIERGEVDTKNQQITDLKDRLKIQEQSQADHFARRIKAEAELDHCQGLLSKACHREIDEMKRGVKAEAQNKLLEAKVTDRNEINHDLEAENVILREASDD